MKSENADDDAGHNNTFAYFNDAAPSNKHPAGSMSCCDHNKEVVIKKKIKWLGAASRIHKREKKAAVQNDGYSQQCARLNSTAAGNDDDESRGYDCSRHDLSAMSDHQQRA
eukprot:scaffold152046_cov55-Attheya_sp.AAC.5